MVLKNELFISILNYMHILLNLNLAIFFGLTNNIEFNLYFINLHCYIQKELFIFLFFYYFTSKLTH